MHISHLGRATEQYQPTNKDLSTKPLIGESFASLGRTYATFWLTCVGNSGVEARYPPRQRRQGASAKLAP
jgi:hypothetical protein